MLQDIPCVEVWADIPDYEGLYQVSDSGRVKSIGRTLSDSKRRCLLRTISTSFLKPVLDGKYFRVNLYKNGKRKSVRIHRLKAIAFIPNPLNYPEVNHKDGNTLNNDLRNLEWVTKRENVLHAVSFGLMKPIPPTQKRKNSRNHKSKRVINTLTGEKFPSINSAAAAFRLTSRVLSVMLLIPMKNTTPLKFYKR